MLTLVEYFLVLLCLFLVIYTFIATAGLTYPLLNFYDSYNINTIAKNIRGNNNNTSCQLYWVAADDNVDDIFDIASCNHTAKQICTNTLLSAALQVCVPQ